MEPHKILLGLDTGALPTTVTELYQSAIAHFDKHHHRKLHRQSSEEAIEKLQKLAYDGIEGRQLVFNNERFDEQMKRSGLLNSLSNPYSQAQTQLCFVHLTIQEFLAARHVTDTFTPEEIKEFIFSHIGSGKWHLVLQFIAGLLGKKNCYKDCVLAFAVSFVCKDGILNVADNSLLFVMKCLREVDDEDIAKEACETTAMNDVVSLTDIGVHESNLTASDWATVTFVCKHMRKLTRLDLNLSNSSEDCYLEVHKLLQQRCIKKLKLWGSLDKGVAAEHLCKTLMKSKCSLKHEHSKLTQLVIRGFHVTDQSLLIMCEFFKHGHASCLETLDLCGCGISSRGVSILCEVLDNKLCPELTYLNLGENSILDEGVTVLCNALIEQKLFTLTELILGSCRLTDECIPSLCELLRDERCNLTILYMRSNEGISDEGLRMLCQSALTKEHCKLAELNLGLCSLTDQCIPEVCKALQDEHWKLTVLLLDMNMGITDEGLLMLCKYALTKEHCKLTKLKLSYCSLSDDCIPELRKALQDEHFVLNKLWLVGNKFTKEGKKSLLEIEIHEHCKARGLEIEVLQ